MALMQRLTGFKLNNHTSFYNDIGHELPNDFSSVCHIKRHLTLTRYAGTSEFNHQSLLVYRFQITRTKMTMDLHCTTNNGFRQLVIFAPIHLYLS